MKFTREEYSKFYALSFVTFWSILFYGILTSASVPKLKPLSFSTYKNCLHFNYDFNFDTFSSLGEGISAF